MPVFIPFIHENETLKPAFLKKGLTLYQQIVNHHGKEKQTARKEIPEEIAVERNRK
jgi:hypothetical protein